MKKGILVFVLMAVAAAGAFAQFGVEADFSISGGGFRVGVNYGAPTFDILAGISMISFNKDKVDKQDNDYDSDASKNSFSEGNFILGIYAGIAPKTLISDKWSFSFPLLAGFHFGIGDPIKLTNGKFPDWFDGWSTDTDWGPSFSYGNWFSVSFDIGTRASYSLNDHWNLYAQANVRLFDWFHWEEYNWKDPSTDGQYLAEIKNGFQFFAGHNVSLGVLYRF